VTDFAAWNRLVARCSARDAIHEVAPPDAFVMASSAAAQLSPTDEPITVTERELRAVLRLLADAIRRAGKSQWPEPDSE
jgi:hypothetical protein